MNHGNKLTNKKKIDGIINARNMSNVTTLRQLAQ